MKTQLGKLFIGNALCSRPQTPLRTSSAIQALKIVTILMMTVRNTTTAMCSIKFDCDEYGRRIQAIFEEEEEAEKSESEEGLEEEEGLVEMSEIEEGRESCGSRILW